MTIRTRLTLGYVGMLLGSLLLMAGILHYELIGEYEEGRPPEKPAVKIEDVLVFYGVPTVFVLLVGGGWLIRRTLRPVESFAAAAERIHAGNLTERIPMSGRGDELDRLAGVFNAMLGRVEAGVASVREFSLRASHELKTPLTILSAETELALGNAEIGDGERERLLSQREELQRLTALVEGLGLLARADAGLPLVARGPLQLDDLVRTAAENARVMAAPHGIGVALGRCDAVEISGDGAALRQVALNLIDNAIKYNRPNGLIRIELVAVDSVATLVIENTGEVLPSALVPRIFDRFARGDRDTRNGIGLGLSIAKAITEAHGGTIACEPRPDGGARFTVRLRVAATAQV